MMAAPCFITVGSEGENAKVSLAEIKVGGYTKIEDEGDGCEGGIILTMLGASGAAKKINGHFANYSWFDLGEDMPAGWYDDDYGMMADAATCEAAGYEQSYWGDAADIFFKSGEGFRVTEHSSYSGLWLSFSGEVRQGAIEFKDFVPADAMACGNPTPTEVPLSKIIVSGYTPIDEEGDGCEGGIIITMLSASGAAKKVDGHFVNFSWFDLGEDMPAGWYDDDYGMMADAKTCEAAGYEQSYWGDAADIKFGPGEGFRATEHSSYSGLTLKFPSPLQAAE